MKKKGFTLLELLIVVAIIAILAVIVFVALDPLTRFKAARDAQRWSDINAMVDAIKLNQIDNNGSFVSTVNTTTAGSYYMIGTCTTGGNVGCSAQTTQNGCVDLVPLNSSGHLPKVPYDPSSGNAEKTDYYISKSSTGAITIGACDPESFAEIELTR